MSEMLSVHQESHISQAGASKIVAAALKVAIQTQINIVCFVVDNNGRVKAQMTMDDAPVIADTMALQKARTALLGLPSAALGEALESGSGDFHSILKQPGANFLAGGVPIVHQGQMLGALGIGGATPEQDLACAQAALTGLVD